ncbi:hypothetical protein [Ketogulonicigenium vulgare]|nr:hypothetical protein [Ketogulonicigenium vulgare]
MASPIDKALAGNRIADHHRDQLLTLVRALARDAARADHAAEGDNL